MGFIFKLCFLPHKHVFLLFSFLHLSLSLSSFASEYFISINIILKMFSEPDLKLSDISKRFSAVEMLQRGAMRHFDTDILRHFEWIILIKRTV